MGNIVLAVPALGWLYLALGLAFLVFIALVVALGHYTRSERAPGVLVAEKGVIGVVPSTPGMVTRMLVREGQSVRMGQPLMEITSDSVSVALGSTKSEVITQLKLKQARLISDIAESDPLTSIQATELCQRIQLLQSELFSAKEQIGLETTRASAAKELYDKWASLNGTGVVSGMQLLQQHDTVLQHQAQIQELERQRADFARQVEAASADLAQLPLLAASKRNETERQLTDVRRSILEGEAERALALSAPVDGVVVNLLTGVGQSVKAQQMVMAIVPPHQRLEVELWVPSSAIGFIEKSDPVRIRYDAFPYQKYGLQQGRVIDISATAVSSEDSSRAAGKTFAEPRYRVRVALDDQGIVAYGERRPLRPGMTLQADIVVARHSLWGWLTEPLAAEQVAQPAGGGT
jgi:membrane fusion protein